MATAGNNPVDEKWWPSEFGTEDKLGAVQHITPEKRIAVVRLVKGVDDWKDGNYFLNGHRLEDVGGPRGLKQVGAEHIAEIGFFTRGILIDIAGLKGVEHLEKGTPSPWRTNGQP